MLKKKLPPFERSGRMKRIAGEGEPVIVVPVVLKPVEVGLAPRAVPPDVRDPLPALEGSVLGTARATVH